MDDSWGINFASEMISFKDHLIPLDQAKLLSVFDLLGVPWIWKKQISGPVIDIIGHVVDSQEMSFTLPPEKKSDLVSALRSFASSFHQRLVNWQRITGWASWGLKSFPLGRFALQSSWEKIGGKSIRNALMPVSCEVKEDLIWLADAIEHLSGKSFVKSTWWSNIDADCILYSDACLTGIGVWYPEKDLGLFLQLPPPSRNIFWAECLAICVAIDKAISFHSNLKRILIYSDSYLCFNLFSSHNPNPMIRPLFRNTIKQIVKLNIDINVFHIPGELNVIAEALSRCFFDQVSSFYPSTKFEQISFDDWLLQGGKLRNLVEFDQNNPSIPL